MDTYNIQLSFLGSIFSIVAVFIYDAKNLSMSGFFHGYSYIVWINIAVQSFGGLLVAVVMKYADNILKGFARSLAIILSCIFSMYLFGTQINATFFFGTLVVVLSVILYSYTPSNLQTTLTTMPISKDTAESISVEALY
jgi:UDP-sugar transporter A1/2/3